MFNSVNPSDSIDTHLERIDARMNKPVSNLQTAVSGLNGVADVVLGTALAGVVWGILRRSKQIGEQLEQLHNNREIVNVTLDKEALSLSSLLEEGWKGARENPKTALAILGATTALGALDGAYTYARFKNANHQEIGERLRAIRERSGDLSPNKLHEASTRILGHDVATEKIDAAQRGNALSS